MNTIVKKGFKLIFTHVMSLALTLFLIMVLGWVIKRVGFYTFSVITSLFYIGLFYSDGWNWGRLEGKSYSKVKQNPLRPLIASIIPSVICITFVVLIILLGNNNILLNLIIKLWYFPFVGFFASTDYITITEILFSGAVIPVVAVCGYFVGVRNFSVLDKIAYAKNKKKIEAKKSETNK